MFKAPCVILAGGKSSRMGKDKSLLPFRGYQSLTQFQHARLSSLFESLLISTKEDKFDTRLELILDDNDEFSPMVALEKIFSNFDNRHIFILSVDTPFVTEKEIKKLYNFIDEFDIVIPKTPSYTHQLCGFYHSSLAPICKKLASNNIHKIRKLYEFAKVKYVEFDNEKPFVNLNYEYEYQKAQTD